MKAAGTIGTMTETGSVVVAPGVVMTPPIRPMPDVDMLTAYAGRMRTDIAQALERELCSQRSRWVAQTTDLPTMPPGLRQ